jgi:ATP-binding protein involved in chromosome partitioning
MSISKEDVRSSLESVKLPESGESIVTRGLVSEIVIAGGRVYFAITAPSDKADSYESLRVEAELVVAKLDGVESVRASLTAEHTPGAKTSVPTNKVGASRNPSRSTSGKAAGGGRSTQAIIIEGVKHIVAVASGKGGVGKSTTAANLALAFHANGQACAVLDADIYGPSMPRLFGIKGRPGPGLGGKLKPMSGYDISVMSMGFLVDEDMPMIWRGPMVISALTQMLREVDWGKLDVLVVDMPPGTGDAQLTMAQQVPLAGAIIVSTPQDLALIDARKGLAMFNKVGVPVLGIIENMSTFICPHCSEESHIFGHGGARLEADKLGVPFLGEIALDMVIRIGSDEGNPIVAADKDSVHAKAYLNIAAQIWTTLEAHSDRTDAIPRLVIED